MHISATYPALLSMTLLVFACSDLQTELSNLGAIQNALKRLGQQRPEGFVVLTHAETQRFVQFVPAERSGFLIDIPAQALSKSEFDRATAFFEQRGLGPPKELELTGQAAPEVLLTFQATLQDARVAAEFAIAFFEQVFVCSPGFQLEITEGR